MRKTKLKTPLKMYSNSCKINLIILKVKAKLLKKIQFPQIFWILQEKQANDSDD